MGQAFALAMKGAKEDEITKMVKKGGGDPRRTLRILKSGKTRKGDSWKVDEGKGRITISGVKTA